MANRFTQTHVLLVSVKRRLFSSHQPARQINQLADETMELFFSLFCGSCALFLVT